ncbi:aldo/keto reductase [Arthrobacter sp. NPDC090010]|uniref:aldo/keto reductase n=1 Tax=Arthrobacter sp. NPDC090010 TaxID=3363942 RepID=UPI003813704F
MTSILSPGTYPLAGRNVLRVGFGAMRLHATPPHFQEARTLLQRAMELGIDHLDTSDYYGPHLVNQAIRHSLHPYPTPLRLITKLGWRIDKGRFIPAADPEDLRRGVEDNLRNLGLDTLDGAYLRLDEQTHARPGSFDAALEELRKMQESGLIRHLGISNASAEQVRHAQRLIKVEMVQNLHHLSALQDDQLIEELAEQEIPYIAFFPLHGVPVTMRPQIATLAQQHSVSPSAAVLALLLRRHPNLLVIPGTSNPQHLEENLQALRLLDPPATQAKSTRAPAP